MLLYQPYCITTFFCRECFGIEALQHGHRRCIQSRSRKSAQEDRGYSALQPTGGCLTSKALATTASSAKHRFKTCKGLSWSMLNARRYCASLTRECRAVAYPAAVCSRPGHFRSPPSARASCSTARAKAEPTHGGTGHLRPASLGVCTG
jgi:hypothetical protein